MPSIAIIGASADRSKFGNKAVRAYLEAGYDVYPVNPSLQEIEGRKVYPTIGVIPVDHLDLVTFYLPPQRTLTVLSELAAKRIASVLFNPGTADQAVLSKAQQLGLPAVEGCSIIAVGRSPSEFN